MKQTRDNHGLPSGRKIEGFAIKLFIALALHPTPPVSKQLMSRNSWQVPISVQLVRHQCGRGNQGAQKVLAASAVDVPLVRSVSGTIVLS